MVLDVGGDGEVGIVVDEVFPGERAGLFGECVEGWAAEAGEEPEGVVCGAEVEIEAHAVFEVGADMHGDMILFLDFVAEGFDFLFEEWGDMLGAGDAGEPFFHGVDLGHGSGGSLVISFRRYFLAWGDCRCSLVERAWLWERGRPSQWFQYSSARRGRPASSSSPVSLQMRKTGSVVPLGKIRSLSRSWSRGRNQMMNSALN